MRKENCIFYFSVMFSVQYYTQSGTKKPGRNFEI